MAQIVTLRVIISRTEKFITNFKGKDLQDEIILDAIVAKVEDINSWQTDYVIEIVKATIEQENRE